VPEEHNLKVQSGRIFIYKLRLVLVIAIKEYI